MVIGHGNPFKRIIIYEVFDNTGNHIGLADLQGNIDPTKKIDGRTITI